MRHGDGAGGGNWKAQPATMQTSPSTETGWPLTKTRALVGMTETCPPCGQDRRPCANVKKKSRHVLLLQVMTIAATLIATLGPVRVMLAPWPLEMMIPVSLMLIRAPDTVFSKIPPVGPGTSLIINVF